MGSNFNFSLTDLASDDTSTDTKNNPYLREYLKGSPTNQALQTSSAYLKNQGQSYDTYASTSMLSISDIMMGGPLQNRASGVLNVQNVLTSSISQYGVAGGQIASAKNMNIFKALTPTDISQEQQHTLTTTPTGSTATVNSSNGAPTTNQPAGGLPSGSGPNGLPSGFVMYPNAGVPVLNFINLAMTKIGDKYVFGAAGPNTFDCCLVGDAMVQTYMGPIMIKDIQPGDFVYSWSEGNLVEHKVIATKNQGKQQIFELRTRNRAIKASANHPFLVARKLERAHQSNGQWEKTKWEFEWKRLDEIQKGDLIITFEHDENNSYNDDTRAPIFDDPYILTEDLAWFLGLFIGDGHVCDGGFRVCVYGPTRARLMEVLNRYGLAGTKHPTHGVYYSSVKWQKLLESFGLRVPSDQKFIPDIIWRANNDLKTAFLKGLWDADGSYGKEKNAFNYHSSSKQLIKETRLLHIMLNDNVSNITTNNRKDKVIIKGKVVKKAQPLHSFTVWFNSNRNMQSVMINQRLRDYVPDDRFAVQRVAEIRVLDIEDTWDLEIEDTHNYIADGILVHNSGLVMWCLQQLGAQFSTWPHYTGDQYKKTVAAKLNCPLEEAYNTAGALLFIAKGGDPAGEHVAISLGNNNAIIEAYATGYTVMKATLHGQYGGNWDVAGLIPGLDYSAVSYGNGISTVPSTPDPATRVSSH